MFSLKALTNTAQQGMWQLGAMCRAQAHRWAGTWKQWKHFSLWKGQSKLSQDAPGSAFHWPGTQVWPRLSKKRRVGLFIILHSEIHDFDEVNEVMDNVNRLLKSWRIPAFHLWPFQVNNHGPLHKSVLPTGILATQGPFSGHTLPRSFLSPELASHLPKANPHKSTFSRKCLQNPPANSTLTFSSSLSLHRSDALLRTTLHLAFTVWHSYLIACVLLPFTSSRPKIYWGLELNCTVLCLPGICH